MSADTAHLLAAGFFLLPALVWSILAYHFWEIIRARPLLRHPALLSLQGVVLMAVVVWIGVLEQLLPAALRELPGVVPRMLIASQDTAVVTLLAVFRHATWYSSFRAEPPPSGWLARNYAACAVVGALVIAGNLGVLRGPVVSPLAVAAVATYEGVMVVLIARRLWHDARQWGYRAGGIGEPHLLDAALIGIGIVSLGASGVLSLVNGRLPAPLLLSGSPALVVSMAALQSAGLLAFATPFVARSLVGVAERLLVGAGAIAASATVYVATRTLAASTSDPETRRLVHVCGVAAIALLVVVGRPWLAAAAERLLLHRTRLRRTALHAFLQTLSPDAGVVECCRRALAEVARVLGLEGAAILLRTGEVIVHGAIDAAPLERVWPRGADVDGLPPGVFVGEELGRSRAVLVEALIAADVPAVVPIVGPRGRWGDLFLRTGFVAASRINFDDGETLETFARQLALLLDSAALLARAVAIERSLAHTEKLAAIGETAARIAHDIRNPVTAARSLAQQLVREPGSPFSVEHGLILEELDRVERQVAVLLRFARREELSIETVDLGELVRAVVAHAGGRLEHVDVTAAVHAPAGVCVAGDREKLRQVVINLVENAIDALGAKDADRHLVVEVDESDGCAALRVRDDGPGVPPDALARLFEPFFSLKSTGTGLGLAIAHRTIAAHGGRIEASSAPGSGMTVHVTLPLAPPGGGVRSMASRAQAR
jgi:signal transduction histidine kinase